MFTLSAPALMGLIISAGFKVTKDYDGYRCRIGVALDDWDDPQKTLATIVRQAFYTVSPQNHLEDTVCWLVAEFSVYGKGRRENAVFNLPWPEGMSDPDDDEDEEEESE